MKAAVEHFDVAVVGGGPAGLRAAEVAAQHGAKVALFDAKPSVGRKFLVAGRGGLNLTHAEEEQVFLRRYRSSGDAASTQSEESRRRWESFLAAFNPAASREWAAGLGVETFVASTGRVYPREMKSAPLLRRWVARLRALGVEFRMRHSLTDLHAGDPIRLDFLRAALLPANASRQSGQPGPVTSFTARSAVLALGGASWPETGSDGGWVGLLRSKGVRVPALQPANCGWEVEWPPEVLVACEGKPLKNVEVSSGSVTVRGELLVTRYGLEGGALYTLSQALREAVVPVLGIDFKPDSSVESLVRRLGTARSNFLSEAVVRWRLDPQTQALLSAFPPSESLQSAKQTALSVKQFQLFLSRPRPLSEAISTAGGVAFSDLDEQLMLRALPGVFIAGEMLDWEAPTGGYLMQGCFATGTHAALGATAWI